MKNLSISKKLIVGFGAVLILMVLSAALSLYSISSIGGQISLYGQYTVPNAEHLRSMQVNMQSILHNPLEAVVTQDAQTAKTALDEAGVRGKEVVAELDAYKSNQRNQDRDAQIEQFRAIITEAAATRGKISELALTRSEADRTKAMALFNAEYKPKIDQAMDVLYGFSTNAQERAVQQRADAQASTTLAWIMLTAFAAVSVALTILVVIVIRRAILTPVKEIMAVYTEIAKGNKQVNVTYEGRDELGQMAALIRATNAQEGIIIKKVSLLKMS